MLIDGSWIDISSFGIALVSTTIRPFRRRQVGHRFHFVHKEVVFDFLSGAAVMPFALMVGALLSSALLKAVLDTNKLYMAIGGFIGLAAIIADLFRQPEPPHL